MIVRDKHKSNYTIVSNAVIRDSRLSGDGLKLLMFMLSCSDKFDFTVQGLAQQIGKSRRTTQRLIEELKILGYLEVKKIRLKNGVYSLSEWVVCEVPNQVPNLTQVPNMAHGEPSAKYDTWCFDSKGQISEEKTPEEPVNHKGFEDSNQVPNMAHGNQVPKMAHIRKNNTPPLKNEQVLYGEFQNLVMTPAQFKKLGDQFGEQNRNIVLEQLSGYVKEHPRKYKDHYLTLRNWLLREQKNPRSQKAKTEPFVNPFTELKKKEGWA